jgi:CRP-like cAMP-binding protein
MRENDIRALGATRLFDKLSEDELNELLKLDGCKSDRFEKDDVIYSPTEYRRELAVFIRGEAVVTKKNTSGKKIIMSVLEPGSVFGMAALFYEKDEFLTTITARKPSLILFMNQNWISEAFSKYPVISVNYISILSERIHFLNHRIDAFSYTDSTDRLMCYLSGFKDNNAEISEITMPVNMADLAEALNLGRSSLYRAFETLESEGVLTRKGKKITVLKPERLLTH